MCVGGMPHIFGKLLTRVTTLLSTNWAQEVMAFQSAMSPNFENFETPNLGVLGQNDIWMQPPWLIIKNT
jgi:hypothetical protein